MVSTFPSLFDGSGQEFSPTSFLDGVSRGPEARGEAAPCGELAGARGLVPLLLLLHLLFVGECLLVRFEEQRPFLVGGELVVWRQQCL